MNGSTSTLLFKASALALAGLALTTCSGPLSERKTMRNAAGLVVVCKAPNVPEFSAVGRVAVVEWCSAACEAHGFKWIGQGREPLAEISDLDLGKKERRVAQRYVPAECLPYETGARGIVLGPDGGPPECLGVLFKDQKCP